MSRRTDVALMIQGLGMAMEFLRRLIARVVERGGYEEMIHFLTTERGESTLDSIADLIIQAPWTVPLSLVQKLAEGASLQASRDGVLADYDRKFFWLPILGNLGIPHQTFGANLGSVIPNEIMDQLKGRKLTFPMHVNYNGEPHLLAQIDGDENEILNPSFVTIVPARRIDLSR